MSRRQPGQPVIIEDADSGTLYAVPSNYRLRASKGLKVIDCDACVLEPGNFVRFYRGLTKIFGVVRE